ncbi:MAG: HupE/UreJ family protein [Candidatus Contendobacter sp.]|nr:HupE/UreJ family protein [Candidatus Contendobacter sp.]
MGAGSRAFAARAGAALGLVFGADVACAHVASAQAGAFYAGLLHPLTAPEHVLPMLALGLLAGQQGLHEGQGALLALVIALVAGAGLAPNGLTPSWISLLNVGWLVVIGGLVAASWRLPIGLLYALALGFGATHGYANGAALPSGLSPAIFILGLATAALLTTGYGLVVADALSRLKPAWPRVAVRVAGSWVAAVGILVLGMGGKAFGGL